MYETKIEKIRIPILNIVLICLGISSCAQTFSPLSLHFKKDYQVRNFYNSSVVLSKLDLSQDVLDESIYPKIHLSSPGCDFKQDGQVIQISNNSGTEQKSFVNLGKLYRWLRPYRSRPSICARRYWPP